MTANEQTINYLNQRVQALEKRNAKLEVTLKDAISILKTTTEYDVVDDFQYTVYSLEEILKNK